MRLSWFLAASSLAFSTVQAVPQDANAQSSTYGQSVLALQARAFVNLGLYVAKNGPFSKTCTLANVAVRREWSTLSPAERKSWSDAVKCLASKPSIKPAGVCPGCKSRYDDFVATHIAQSGRIHGTGNFVTWHRYFTWAFEKALREECGYKGYQPYADWGKYAQDPLHSPVFDGSDSSVGGNGAFANRSDFPFPPNQPAIVLPGGTGGGCITNGPFVNMKANLGPCFPIYTDVPPNPQQDCLGYNPRCLRRDISQFVSSHFCKDSDAVDLITKYTDFLSWHTRLQGDFPSGFLGYHFGGHQTWGGDPGGDFVNSPGDPTFFLHHSQIDRIYWIWQNQDPGKRTYSVAGPTNPIPPASGNTTLDDPLNLDVNGGTYTIRDVGSTIGGPLCYIFA